MRKKNIYFWIFLILFIVTLSTVCVFIITKKTTAQPAIPESIPERTLDPTSVSQEALALAEAPEPSGGIVLKPEPSGIHVASNEYATVDYSHTEDGYAMVLFTASTDKKIKFQVTGPTSTYTYTLTPGEWTTFPLSDGNGNYSIKLYENIVDTRYAQVLSVDLMVSLDDEFAPFIRPNQYVNYEIAPLTVKTAASLTAGSEELLERVGIIYDYVVKHIAYDYEKADTVKSGYLPDLDQVLTEQKGICFDYASVMTGMLRSLGIPCKLVIGYAGDVYHAWISVWSEATGWIDGAVFFNGTSWQRMDPTFASSGGDDKETLEFIGNGDNYIGKYIY